MNKKIYASLIVIFILIGSFYFWKINQKDSNGCFINKGYSWCKFKEQCIKKGEECNLSVDWIIKEAKKIMGLDINIMPNQFIKWNTENEKIAFVAKGFVYTDVFESEKIIKLYNQISTLLKQSGLQENNYNPAVDNEKEKSSKYKKEEIVCALTRTNNTNNSSSLLFLCGDINERLYTFDSSYGRECGNDSDCGLVVNGCEKKVVCRNRNYKFYHDCLNPTANVDKLDTRIGECLCLENQCVPKNEKLRSQN